MDKKSEVRLTVRFPTSVMNDLRSLVENDERSLNWEVIEAVRQYIKQRKGKDDARIAIPKSKNSSK